MEFSKVVSVSRKAVIQKVPHTENVQCTNVKAASPQSDMGSLLNYIKAELIIHVMHC